MSAPAKWRQHVIVTGRSLRRLVAVTNLKVPEGQQFLTLRGHGAYFPVIEGFDWRAECHPPQQSDAGLGDIRPLLDALIGESFLIVTDAPGDEVSAFMQGAM